MAISSRRATCFITASFRTKEQRRTFETAITRHTMIHEADGRFFQGFRRDAHPMAVMVAVVGAFPLSIMTRLTSMIRASARLPATA